MACYAVVDTNVIVAALLSKKNDTAAVQVFRAMLDKLGYDVELTCVKKEN